MEKEKESPTAANHKCKRRQRGEEMDKLESLEDSPCCCMPAQKADINGAGWVLLLHLIVYKGDE